MEDRRGRQERRIGKADKRAKERNKEEERWKERWKIGEERRKDEGEINILCVLLRLTEHTPHTG